MVVSRRILVRLAVAVVALFLLSNWIAGAVGEGFWIAFLLGLLLLIVLGVVALFHLRQPRAR
jgi:hypothetical protein